MECCCGICMEETPADQLLRFCDGGKHCFCRECFGSYKTKSFVLSHDENSDEYHNEEYDMREDWLNKIPCPICRKPIEFLEDARFTGKLEGFYRNGAKKWEIEYKDGRRDGLMQIWADNEVLYKKISYVRGLKEGPYQTFRSHSHRDLRLPGDGSLVSEVGYLAGVKEGEEIEWYPHGWIKARRVYVNGFLDGPAVSYFNGKYGADGYPIDDGSPQKVMSENYYINGLLNGTSISYWENGQIGSMGEYIDGKMNGVHKRWYKDGTLNEETHYQLGQKSGERRTWHPNGQLRSITYYKNDLPTGDYKEWRDDGEEVKYVNLSNYIDKEKSGKMFI